MKRVVAFLCVLVFICSNIVFAEDTTPRIDFSAMQWYAQATNAAAERLGHPYTMTAADDNGSYSLAAGYISAYSQTATFEEALTSKELPVNLMISYSSISNAVAFIFGSKTISEIPLSIEAYIDGIRYQGGVLAPPEGSNPATSISGFFFDLNTVQQMMQSQDIFVRLLTDKGASFIEVSADNTLLPYCMLGLVCNGAEYCWKDSSVYLDKTRLWSEIQNWQPQGMSVQQTPEYTQPKSFQTDYEAIDQAAQSAFLLEVYDKKDQVIGTGSGFVAFDKGVMITNEHVIEDAAYIIAYSDQYRNAYKLTELKAVDKEKDIAILAFDKTANVKPLKVDGTSRLLRGQPVTAIGSPQGILNTVSSGNISNIVYYSDVVQDAIQFTAPISPGSSGGALFSDQGYVIGLCVSSHREGDAMYYAIPIKYVEELYKVSQSTAATTLRSYNGLDFGAPKLTIGAHGVILEWEAVPGSTEYIIYRKTEDQGASFKEIARVAKPGTLDSSAKKGMTYEYYIEAHKGDEILRSGIAKITRPAPAATPTPIAGKFAAPELTVKNGVGIYIRWDAVSNAAGYTVYRRIANSQEEFKLLALSPSYSYLDTSVQKGVSYEYCIGARINTSISMSRVAQITYLHSSAATPTPIAGKFAAPELTVKNGVGIYIRWNAVSNAAGYTVYRRIANSQEEFKLLALSPSYSYLDTSVQKGVSYEYCIGARINTSVSMSRVAQITYPHSSAATATPKPAVNNGQMFIMPDYTSVCPFEVKAGFDSDYYVYLKYQKTPAYSQSVRTRLMSASAPFESDIAFIVKAGQTYELDVPIGVYKLYYATGKTFFNTTILFGDTTRYYESDELLTFNVSRDYYNGHTITLYEVVDGNLETEEISEKAFPTR